MENALFYGAEVSENRRNSGLMYRVVFWASLFLGFIFSSSKWRDWMKHSWNLHLKKNQSVLWGACIFTDWFKNFVGCPRKKKRSKKSSAPPNQCETGAFRRLREARGLLWRRPVFAEAFVLLQDLHFNHDKVQASSVGFATHRAGSGSGS